MGVSGSGKTLVGQHLAQALGRTFFDADDFHSPENIRKMASGRPLLDPDRQTWLNDLAQLLQNERGCVLACSALKKSYRDFLRAAAGPIVFLYLKGDFDLIWPRLAQRQDHYFNGSDMLRNQFEQLEEPAAAEAHAVDIAQSPEAVVADCLSRLEATV